MSQALTLKQRFNPRRFLRGYELKSGKLTLRRDQIFILPTRQGWLFSLVLLVMLLGALNYDNSLLFAFTFWLASLGFVSMHHSFLNLHKLEVSVASVENNFAGEPVKVRLHIKNECRKERVAVAVQFQRHEPSTLNVPPEQIQTVSLALDTRNRGRFTLPRIVISTIYPTGLFRAWAYANFDQAYRVYPKPSGTLPLPVAASASPQGQQRSHGDEDFSGLRDYQLGDSPRRIHWRRSTRSNSWVTKQFETMGASECKLTWHLIPLTDTEKKLSQLCQWITQAHQQGVAFSLELPRAFFAKRHSAKHREQCLIALAEFSGDK